MKKIIFIFLCIFLYLFYSVLSHKPEQKKYMCNGVNIGDMNIITNVKIQQVIEWFSVEFDSVDYRCTSSEQNFRGVFLLKEQGKKTGTLELIFLKDKEYYPILKMCINGTPKTFGGEGAKRIMLAFLSENDTFDYYYK